MEAKRTETLAPEGIAQTSLFHKDTQCNRLQGYLTDLCPGKQSREWVYMRTRQAMGRGRGRGPELKTQPHTQEDLEHTTTQDTVHDKPVVVGLLPLPWLPPALLPLG